MRCLEKLDRFLVLDDWEGHFSRVVWTTLSRPISDHFPILLDGGVVLCSSFRKYVVEGEGV